MKYGKEVRAMIRLKDIKLRKKTPSNDKPSEAMKTEKPVEEERCFVRGYN